MQYCYRVQRGSRYGERGAEGGLVGPRAPGGAGTSAVGTLRQHLRQPAAPAVGWYSAPLPSDPYFEYPPTRIFLRVLCVSSYAYLTYPPTRILLGVVGVSCCACLALRRTDGGEGRAGGLRGDYIMSDGTPRSIPYPPTLLPSVLASTLAPP